MARFIHNRLPLALSTTALVVALYGTTPLGGAASKLVRSVPPFAHRADFATRAGFARHAKLADVATNAKLVVGHRISTSPKAGDIPVLGGDGKLPASIGGVGPPGPAGATGPSGTANIVERVNSTSGTGTVVAPAACAANEHAVGGGAYIGLDSVSIIDSFPSNAGGVEISAGQQAQGWTVYTHNIAGGSYTVSTRVLCAS
jgi:hypothetical protein